jgi:CRP/FNR family transcriptional regulator, cyclic AMP receptor protein
MNKKKTNNRITMLGALSPKQQLKLSLESPSRNINKREQIYLPGEDADYVYVIQSGRVKLSRCSDCGKEVILSIMGPGEVFGLEPLLGHSDRRAHAVALEGGRLLALRRDRFQELILENPELLMTLLKIVNERLWDSRDNLSRLVFSDVKSRLAALLLNLARSEGKVCGNEIRLEAPITHQDLANLIGSTRETTTATLNQFKRAQLIQFDRRRIVISGLGGLEALAAS